MVKYIIKRIVLVPILLIVISAIIFGLVNLNPVDPATTLLPSSATQEDRDQLHREYGLDKPLIVQYFNYMKNLFKGDLGTSWFYKTPVIDEVKDKIPVTAKLAVYSTIVTIVVGLPLGVICAVYQYSVADELLNGVSKLLGSLPQFAGALFLMLIFAVKLKILPLYGFTTWKNWILPVATISIQTAGTYLRIARSSMLDSIHQDYVRTARAKGCREGRVIYVHALKNALLPVITFTGQMFASMMGGALVVETVFSIPGLGSAVIHAVKIKDIPMTMGSVLIISAIFLIANFIIDMVYVAVDPRVKATFTKAKKTKQTNLEYNDDELDEDEETAKRYLITAKEGV